MAPDGGRFTAPPSPEPGHKAELFGSNRVRRAALERSIGQTAGPARGAGGAQQAASGLHRGASKNARTASGTAPNHMGEGVARRVKCRKSEERDERGEAP